MPQLTVRATPAPLGAGSGIMASKFEVPSGLLRFTAWQPTTNAPLQIAADMASLKLHPLTSSLCIGVTATVQGGGAASACLCPSKSLLYQLATAAAAEQADAGAPTPAFELQGFAPSTYVVTISVTDMRGKTHTVAGRVILPMPDPDEQAALAGAQGAPDHLLPVGVRSSSVAFAGRLAAGRRAASVVAVW
jgi:hypothetical protein